MLAARKSWLAGELVVVTGVEHAAAKVIADTHNSLLERVIVLVAKEGRLLRSVLQYQTVVTEETVDFIL
jgi:hypothetical protein